MAYADYLDLRLAVGENTGRRDLPDIMPTLVKRAETRLNRDLRVVQQETDATIAMVSGVGTLPSDFLEPKRVYTSSQTYTQGPREQVDVQSSSRYAVSASSLYLSGFDGDLELRYYAALPTISGAVDSTNWLLTDGPDLYLYAVSREVAQHIRDREMRDEQNAEYKLALHEIRGAAYRSQWGDARVTYTGPTP